MRKYRLPLFIMSFAMLGGALLLCNNESSVRLLADDETYVIHLGDKVTISDRRISYDSEIKMSKVRLFSPTVVLITAVNSPQNNMVNTKSCMKPILATI